MRPVTGPDSISTPSVCGSSVLAEQNRCVCILSLRHIDLATTHFHRCTRWGSMAMASLPYLCDFLGVYAHFESILGLMKTMGGCTFFPQSHRPLHWKTCSLMAW